MQFFKVNSGNQIQIVMFMQQMFLPIEAFLHPTVSIYLTFPYFFITVMEGILNLELIELGYCLYSIEK